MSPVLDAGERAALGVPRPLVLEGVSAEDQAIRALP